MECDCPPPFTKDLICIEIIDKLETIPSNGTEIKYEIERLFAQNPQSVEYFSIYKKFISPFPITVPPHCPEQKIEVFPCPNLIITY